MEMQEKLTDGDGDDKLDELMDYFAFAHANSEYKGCLTCHLTYADGSKTTRSIVVDPEEGVEWFAGPPPGDVKPTVEVSAPRDTFMEMYEGTQHPATALLKGKVWVHGFAFAEARRFGNAFDYNHWAQFYLHSGRSAPDDFDWGDVDPSKPERYMIPMHELRAQFNAGGGKSAEQMQAKSKNKELSRSTPETERVHTSTQSSTQPSAEEEAAVRDIEKELEDAGVILPERKPVEKSCPTPPRTTLRMPPVWTAARERKAAVPVPVTTTALFVRQTDKHVERLERAEEWHEERHQTVCFTQGLDATMAVHMGRLLTSQIWARRTAKLPEQQHQELPQDEEVSLGMLWSAARERARACVARAGWWVGSYTDRRSFLQSWASSSAPVRPAQTSAQRFDQRLASKAAPELPTRGAMSAMSARRLAFCGEQDKRRRRK